ncbi:hypothetical protein BDY19DRAFT_1047000 [Irpex rosettiformis]|uniref:Uncharacterized protein n=1 Tax=Irpex rosettiformis TaxID=378272 RepID=A0ACB8UAJ8_9APHY|nr:hypothetical protein BDY19DRAFT_1047000 [Irpex rosettiformis]
MALDRVSLVFLASHSGSGMQLAFVNVYDSPPILIFCWCYPSSFINSGTIDKFDIETGRTGTVSGIIPSRHSASREGDVNCSSAVVLGSLHLTSPVVRTRRRSVFCAPHSFTLGLSPRRTSNSGFYPSSSFLGLVLTSAALTRAGFTLLPVLGQYSKFFGIGTLVRQRDDGKNVFISSAEEEEGEERGLKGQRTGKLGKG